MPGSEDAFEEAKVTQAGAEEFMFERRAHGVRESESKYFEGASCLPDLPQNPSGDEPFPNHEGTDAIRIESEGLSEGMSGSIDSCSEPIRLAEGPEQTVDLDSIYIQLDPPAKKIDLNELLETARIQFKDADYASCLKTLSAGLGEDPGNYHMSVLQKEAQRKYELLRAEEELASQIASVKSEAMSLFQSGQFDECLEKFKLLCKLEPDNRDFRDFLQASEEQLGKERQSKTEATSVTQSKPASASDKDVVARPREQPTKPLAEPPLQRQVPQPKGKPEQLEVEAKSKTKRLVLPGLILAAVLFGAIVGGWLTTRHRQSSSPEFQVEPEGASAYSRREPNAGPERLKIPHSQAEELQSSATMLFDQGKLLEASRKCDEILAEDAESRFALGLKQDIRARMAREGNQAMAANRWEEARTTWTNVLKVDSGDAEANHQLRVVRAKMKKQEQLANAGKVELQHKIQDFLQQIVVAVNAKNYFPPNSGNAFDLIKQLSNLSPSDSLAKEKLDQIYVDLLDQTHRKIQSRDFTGANVLTQQIQTYFPESSELKGLRETLKTEESKLMDARNALTQRAEAAMVAGRYLLPPNDNTVAYCNQILMVDPQNQKALALKKDSLLKAGAQAQEWIQKGKFEEASGIYSSLLYLSQNESRFPLSAQDLKRELQKLEFTASPMMHVHAIGSCSGRLRFNGYMIAYVPSGESRDGFNQPLKDILQIEGGDKLKIQLKDKTYRFEVSTAKNKEENREKIKSMLDRLNLLTSKQQ